MSKLERLLVLLVPLFLFISCDSRRTVGPVTTETPNLVFAEEKIDLDDGNFRFRQFISLESPSPEIYSYAYRINTLQEGVLPGFHTDDAGWILWPGGDIWTEKAQISIDFDSVNGSLANLVCSVSTRVKYPDAHIEELSSAFKSNRFIGSTLTSPTDYGGTYSSGIEFILLEQIGDIFVDGNYAHHFMYRINQLDSNQNVVSEGNWFNSIECPDIRKIHLSQYSAPALIVNEDNSYTEFEYYVVSRAGIEQQDAGSFIFRVVAGFRPVAMVYPQTTIGLGSYHYSSWTSYDNPPLPANSHGYPRQLWNVDGVNEAINSTDFKLHINWGYNGQYGFLQGHYVTNNPLDGWEANIVLNENNIDYGSRIVAFWLRFDGDPFPIQDCYFGPEFRDDPYGNTWLRIINLNKLSRSHIFENLDDGSHLFEVMVEDLQGELSDICRYEFNLAHLISPQARDGILIVDDDTHNSSVSPDGIVDNFYDTVVPNNFEPVLTVDSDQVISAVAFMNYEAVLIHADNPTQNPNFVDHLDALNIYLNNMGNLILSGTHHLISSYVEMEAVNFASEQLGINNINLLESMGASPILNAYFIEAQGLQEFVDIPLNLDTAFNPIVEFREGLSSITLFDPALNLDWIYSCGCKPVDYENFPPTQEQYDYFSSKYVAYRYNSGHSSVAVFGFPLSYMDSDTVSSALAMVFEDFRAGQYAQGRR